MVDSDWKSIYLTIQVQFVRYKLFSFLVKYFYDKKSPPNSTFG